MTRSELECAAAFIGNTLQVPASTEPLAGAHLLERLRLRERRRVRRRVVAIGIVACALAVGGGYSLHSRERALTYQVDGSSGVGSIGSYVSAPSDSPVALRFSEGSQVVFAPKARGRVAQTTRRGATMVLENGRARADIVHRNNTDWQVYAGPYVLNVTGTSFDVSYEVATQTFELNMHTGSVRVTGPGLVRPIEVADAQRLVLSATAVDPQQAAAASSSVELAPAPAVPPASETKPEIGVVPQSSALRGTTIERRDSAVGAVSPVRTDGLSWSQLAANGQYSQILEQAQRRGTGNVLASASSADLLAFGNAARFSGKYALATHAYQAVRERFSRSAAASSAAFFLGRLSESSDPNAAIGWYERYVAEAAGGSWVAEARGRTMVILHNTKGPAASVPAAKDYLANFPNGPYAGFAKQIQGL